MTRNINHVGVPVAQLNKRSKLSAADLIPQFIQSSGYVLVAPNAVSLQYGAWTEIIASTSADASLLALNLGGIDAAAVATAALLDVALGASGSENIIISSIPCGYTLDNFGQMPIFPISIPKGSRISVRLLGTQTATPTYSLDVMVGLYKDFTGKAPSRIDTYGAVTASARGTNMPTSNTYVQITAATTSSYCGLIMLPAAATNTFSGILSNPEISEYTLAIGQSGSEQVVGKTSVYVTSNESMWVPMGFLGCFFGGDFPAGTRISCKQSVGRTYRDVIVYGVPYA